MATSPVVQSRRRSWTVALAAAAASAALATMVSVRFRETSPVEAPEIRTEIVTLPTDSPTSFALSPDGQRIVYSVSEGGVSSLWLRSLATTTAERLSGTERASAPFWKPDGQAIGFFADGKLKRLDLGGGAPRQLAAVAFPAAGGTWSSSDLILFARTATAPLVRIPASGGEVVPMTGLRSTAGSQRQPSFLPDGRHFLYWASTTTDGPSLYLGSIESDAVTRLASAETGGMYLPSGWLIWGRARSLVAQRWDLDRLAFSGNPVTVADIGEIDVTASSRPFSLSSNGLIAYRAGAVGGSKLQWFDPSGKTIGLASGESRFLFPTVAPDGRRILAFRSLDGNMDIWLVDGQRLTRLTSSPDFDRAPHWAPDGMRFVFDSIRDGKGRLYLGRVDSPNGETLLKEWARPILTQGWSADGRSILYVSLNLQGGVFDVSILPLDGDRPGKEVFCLRVTGTMPWSALSPDGRWVAYESGVTGQSEIYIRSVNVRGAAGADSQPACSTNEWPASAGGGTRPVWRRDGKELYYLSPDGQLMAVPVSINGDIPERGTPVRLFATHIFGYANGQYDVAPNGSFLINSTVETSLPITLLQNWKPPAK